MRSLFIVLDGLDGSGKGEMIKRLEEYLSKKKNLKILVTKEPTDGIYGKSIREILRNEKDPKAGAEKCLTLFVKDREEHLEKEIEPFLKEDDHIVICDRYYYSTMAFQHTQGIEMEEIIAENKLLFVLSPRSSIFPSLILFRIKDSFSDISRPSQSMIIFFICG